MEPSFLDEIDELFTFKRRMTRHLDRFTQEAMRAPSPLSPGFRELIAAFTSQKEGGVRGDCGGVGTARAALLQGEHDVTVGVSIAWAALPGKAWWR